MKNLAIGDKVSVTINENGRVLEGELFDTISTGEYVYLKTIDDIFYLNADEVTVAVLESEIEVAKELSFTRIMTNAKIESTKRKFEGLNRHYDIEFSFEIDNTNSDATDLNLNAWDIETGDLMETWLVAEGSDEIKLEKLFAKLTNK